MNRIKAYFEEPEEQVPVGDYYVVSGTFGIVYVTEETARVLEKELDRIFPARWLVFRDISGSRVRVLRSEVRCVSECTAAQRRADRAFYRALENESEADRRPWEDD